MRFAAICVVCVLLFAGPASAGGFPPWEFGMSKAQVSGFSEFGPYRSFTNGDLETYNGLYDGRTENVQFFFDQSGLRRIAVYLYEGKDLDEATAIWKRAYASLQAHYGAVETPGFGKTSDSAPDFDLLALSARTYMEKNGKSAMAPVKQPGGLTVFSVLKRFEYLGDPVYNVIINFDRPE